MVPIMQKCWQQVVGATGPVTGKSNSHAVEMAEHDPLFHAWAQRSTPNSEPRGKTKACLYAGWGGGADRYYLRENAGRSIAQSGKRGLQKQNEEVGSSYPK